MHRNLGADRIECPCMVPVTRGHPLSLFAGIRGIAQAGTRGSTAMTIETASQPVVPERPQLGPRVSRIATVLVSNAIPLFGVLYYGWSAINVLVLYWLENLLVAIFTCLRIAAHRRLTRRSGHWRGATLSASPGDIGQRPALLRDYAVIAFVFTLAHGLFVVVIALLLARRHPDAPMWQFAFGPFRQGAWILLGTLMVDFCVDLAGLRSRSFAWLKGHVQQRMGRVLVLHLAIIVGMFAMAATASPFGVLYALIGMKTLWDLAMARAGDVSAAAPIAPPAWLLKVGGRMAGNEGGRAALAKQWSVALETARRQGIEDEQPMPR